MRENCFLRGWEGKHKPHSGINQQYEVGWTPKKILLDFDLNLLHARSIAPNKASWFFRFSSNLYTHKCRPSEVLHCNYNGEIGQKLGFGHNFWLEDSIDLRTTRLNHILQDFSRDTPLDHIWRIKKTFRIIPSLSKRVLHTVWALYYVYSCRSEYENGLICE